MKDIIPHGFCFFRSRKKATQLQPIIRKCFNTSCITYKEIPKNSKAKGSSSHQWLTRQLNDEYVEKAKMMNYRCRSAFKLLEMDDKHHFLAAGQCVVDCGAAPGSWTQILVDRTNSLGTRKNLPVGYVLGIDCTSIYPIEGAILLNNLDFTSKEAETKLQQELKGRKVDVVLSDMAPNATGVKFLDHEKIIHLAYNVLRFSVQVSVIGSTMLIKIWDGRDAKTLERDIKKYYSRVKSIKPKASRSDSSEMYFLAKEFKGLLN